MSSPGLRRRTPEPAEHRDALAAALDEVAAESFFAYVEPLDGDVTAGDDAWLEVEVGFAGAFGGALRVVLPEPLAHELHASFLGREPGRTPPDRELFDLAGEFGNMVCGRWLTRACGRRRFNLRAPLVHRSGPPPPDPDALCVAINGRPAWLRIRFEAA
ncbi:MAG TPA: chemotaxis protein CheX, partial [Vicinamibacterales bacterium]